MTKQQRSQKAPTDNTNAAGYSDPTAYQAIRSISTTKDVDKKATILAGIIKTIAELAGFRFQERFILRHLKTGKIYK